MTRPEAASFDTLHHRENNMDQLDVSDRDIISLDSTTPNLSGEFGSPNEQDEDISISNIETIDSAADFNFEIFYVIFKHLKKVIGWSSPFLKITEIIVITSVYVSIITGTFLLAFHRANLPILVIFYSSDGIYILHLLFITFVALSPASAWSTPNQLNYRQQCRLHCLIDLITAIPLEFLLPRWLGSQKYSIIDDLSAVGRLNRLLRVYRLARFFKSKKNDVILGTRYSDILSATCTLTLLIHISACCWYWMGCKAFTEDYMHTPLCWCLEAHQSNALSMYSYFEYHPLDFEEKHGWTVDMKSIIKSVNIDYFLNMYAICAYWSTVTALGVGFGDYRGLGYNEVLFSILVMLFGSTITNGLVVGSLTSLLTNVESQRATFTHRLMIIKRYLDDNKYSSQLSETIKGFYEYMWFKKKGQTKGNMYETLPLSLQSEICHSVNHCALSRSPMFRSLDEGFLRCIALKIQNHFYLPGQIVINKGTVSRCMYYIVRGELEVLDGRDNSTPVAVLRPGKPFGEVNLVLNFARTASIRAATHCDLLVLNQHDVTPVLLHYPEARLAMWEYVKNLFDMEFNKEENASKSALARSALDVTPMSGEVPATVSRPFSPALSTMAEAEESSMKEGDESSIRRLEADAKSSKETSPPEGEIPMISRFPEIDPTRSSTNSDMTHIESSSIPVFRESKTVIEPFPKISSSLNRQTLDRQSSSNIQQLKKPSMHFASSSRRVLASDVALQRGDEPKKSIPAFDKPDELLHASGDCSQRNVHFDWAGANGESVRRQVRRPTIHARPKGMSEVQIGQSCAVLQSEGDDHGIPWLKKLVHHVRKPCIQEDSMFETTWQTFVWVVVIVQWYVYLYYASFQDGYSPAMLSMTYFLDAVHVVDIMFKLMTVVISPRETYETYRQILHYRARTVAFYLDLLAALPLDLLCLPFTLSLSPVRRNRCITICKLNKLAKAWVIPHRFRYFEDQLYVPLQAMRPIELIIYILMGIHLSACLWFMDANVSQIVFAKPAGDMWMKQFIKTKTLENAMKDSDISPNNSAYVLSLYWAAATMSTTGYGDIVAKTTTEYFLSIITMVLGLVLFAYSLASYASLLTNMDRPKVQFQSIVFAMEQFMVENRLEKILRKRVLRYMDVQWNAYDGLIMPGKPSLLHDLPEALQQDLAADGIVKLLGSVPLFHGTDATFRQELSRRCSRYLFPPNEYVLYSGDLGRDMYIIIRGYCESFIGKRQKSLGMMGPGEYFGEAGMLFGLPRPAHVVTRTHCNLLAIPHGELQRIMKRFPTVNQDIRNIQGNVAILRTVKLNHARVWRLSKDLPHSDDSLFILEEPPSFTAFPEEDGGEEQYRKPFAELGGAAVLGRLLMERTVRPDGRAAVGLECCRIAAIMLVLVLTPVHVTFLWRSFTIYAVGLLLDAIAVVHIYLRLHWAYYNETSTLITHPVATARNYLASAFLLDLAGCFPFDLVAMLFFQGRVYDNLHIIVLFRINRMVQAYEIAWAFYYWERRLVFRSGLFKVMKYLCYFGLYVHIISCSWAYLACPALFSGQRDQQKSPEGRMLFFHMRNDTEFTKAHTNCNSLSWYSTSELAKKTNSALDFYVVSTLYTLEMVASVGYGDMTPQTRTEFILCIVLMIHGVIFFGFVIASVTASFVNADISRASFNERVKKLAEQMRYELVPAVLQKKVLRHIEYEFFRSQGMEAHTLFTNLPPSIRGDVAIVLFEELISSVPIFETIDRSFHRMLAMCLKEAFFLEGETVIFEGDIGQEMFFIHRGLCDIIDIHGNAVKTLGPGRFFGEISVMFSIPRTVTILARTNADLFVLTKNDLQDVLENYPEIKREIERIAMERLQDAGQRQTSREDEHSSHRRFDTAHGRTNSAVGASLMESRHGRKHKTHHRRSLGNQFAAALHGFNKDRNEQPRHGSALIDEYKDLLESEARMQQEQHQAQKRRSSLTPHLIKMVSKLFPSHSLNPRSPDNTTLHHLSENLEASGSNTLQNYPEGSPLTALEHATSSTERPTKMHGPPKLPPVGFQGSTKGSTSSDSALKEERHSSELLVTPLKRMPSITLSPSTDEVPATNLSPSTEEVPATNLSPSTYEVSATNLSPSTDDVPATYLSPSTDEVPATNLSPSTDEVPFTNLSSSAHEVSSDQPEGLKETATSRMDEAASGIDVRKLAAQSQTSRASLTASNASNTKSLHEVYMSNQTIETESKATIVMAKSTASWLSLGSGASLHSSNKSDKSFVSGRSSRSARSEFRPPSCLTAWLQGISRLVQSIIPTNFVINPESRLLLVFNLLLTICGVMSNMIQFYQIAFVDFNNSLNCLLFLTTLVFALNIYIRMHTAYYDNYGDLVRDHTTVRRQYMHRPTGFLVDMLSALPVGVLALIYPELWPAIINIRFVQLVRFYTVFSFFRSWERVLNAPILFLRGVRDLGLLLLLLHIWACFWYIVACPLAQCREDSWVYRQKLRNTSNHERYLNAVYFIAATMTTTGYGDIHPNNIQEAVVAIFAIIVGKFAIGLIIGDLASTLSNLELARVEMETMLGVIVNQMEDQTVPKHLQKRVVQHVTYDWLRNRGHNLKELLQDLPHCLRVEVFEAIYGDQLRSLSIFELAPDYLIRRLSALCEQQVFLPGDFITKRGDIGRRVYIIRRGSVLVYRTSPSEPEYFLYSGSIYGDVQIVFPTIPYEHSLVADYPSDVLVINQPDIQLLLADNPQFYFKVRRYIQKKYADIVQDRRPSMSPNI